MLTISTKHKDQHVIWQNCLIGLDSSSKNQLSKERERRRNTVQQQLDKSSAIEDQLRELIEGLEAMNYKLADEVKSVKKDKQEAIKLYDKSKEAAAKCLEKLQLEKEEKNELKDKLTQALKAQELQQNEISRLLKAQDTRI
jgi:hypothetical protein